MTKHVWAPNSGTNTVSKIDPVGDTVLATYTVGNTPRGICYDGVNFWVANDADNTVTKISPTGSVIATVTVGLEPFTTIFANGFVWVANFTGGTVSKIDIHSNTVVATITVGTSPLCFAYDGLRLWVTNNGDNTVSKIDVSSNTVLATYSTGTGPRGIAWDGSSLWIANYGSGNVKKHNPVTGAVLATVTVGTNPTYVGWDGKAIWVSNFGSANVSKVDPVANSVTVTITVGTNPHGVAWDGNYIWIFNFGSNNVSKIDPVGNTVVDTVTVGAGPMGGGAFALSPYRVKRTTGDVHKKDILPSFRSGARLRRRGYVYVGITPTVSRNADSSWHFTWTGGSAPWSIWLDGRLLETVTTPVYDFTMPGYPDEPPDLEILNQGVVGKNQLYPPFVIIQWRGVQGVLGYIVELYNGSSASPWSRVADAMEVRKGYYQWTSQALADDTIPQYRVSTIDLNGNKGTPIVFTVHICCPPKHPEVVASVGSSGAITISQGS